jgi:dTDP-4-dehydrorhamnose 3,5-epimerase
MKISTLDIPGALIVDVEELSDERGFFARTFCRQEFAAHGLSTSIAQSSISFNKLRGTLRGMHYQTKPHEEAKLVRCTKGVIYDVIIDLRNDSPTFKQWLSVELSADNHRGLYIPEGVAHGFLTLADDCEVLYQISEFFHPECASGVRWNDPAFGIHWPEKVCIISERDQRYADFIEGAS